MDGKNGCLSSGGLSSNNLGVRVVDPEVGLFKSVVSKLCPFMVGSLADG